MRWSNEEIDYLIQNYSKEPIDNLCFNLNRSWSAVRWKAFDLRLFRPSHIKRIDTSYFEKINSEDRSYFLGLLYADGNVCQNKLDLRLVESGGYILERLAKHIYLYDFTIYDVPSKVMEGGYITKPQKRLNIYSKKICDDLIKLGCTPNKSHSIIFPTFISDELMPHFIRGYFDGDGCISFSITKDNNLSTSFTISSVSHGFCNSFKNYLEKILNITLYLSKNKTAFVVRTSKLEDIIKINNYLYENMTTDLFFENKYKKFVLLEQMFLDKNFKFDFVGKDPDSRKARNKKISEGVRKLTSEDEKDICNMYINGKTMNEIASLFNVYQSTIRRYLLKNDVIIRSNWESRRFNKSNNEE